jgi:hypothetical protein
MGDLSVGTVMLTLVGIGIIVVGVLLLLNQTPVQRPETERQTERVVIRENPWWPGYPGRIGPYYSHLPVRHLVY